MVYITPSKHGMYFFSVRLSYLFLLFYKEVLLRTMLLHCSLILFMCISLMWYLLIRLIDAMKNQLQWERNSTLYFLSCTIAGCVCIHFLHSYHIRTLLTYQKETALHYTQTRTSFLHIILWIIVTIPWKENSNQMRMGMWKMHKTYWYVHIESGTNDYKQQQWYSS